MLLLAAALVADPPLPPAAPSAVSAARRALEQCGEDGRKLASQSDRTWTLPGDLFARHRELRAEHEVPMPSGKAMVAVFAESWHLAVSKTSLVLTREAPRDWRASLVWQSRATYAGAPLHRPPPDAWSLSAKHARRLDAILESGCIFAEPTYFEYGGGPPPPSYGRVDVAVAKGTRQHFTQTSFVGAKGQPAELLTIADAITTARSISKAAPAQRP